MNCPQVQSHCYMQNARSATGRKLSNLAHGGPALHLYLEFLTAFKEAGKLEDLINSSAPTNSYSMIQSCIDSKNKSVTI